MKQNQIPAWLPSNSDIAKIYLQFDWSSTPLGPIDQWPISLKNTVALILGSKFPMFIWWGKDLINIYNDAYALIAGPDKHPRYLGRPAHHMWSEIWDTIEPLAHKVISSGESLAFENLPLSIIRNGLPEEAYFTFSYSPTFSDEGGINGILGVVQETTQEIVSRRETEFERKKISDLFMNSSVAFARTTGPRHVLERVNPAFLELIGQREVIGKDARSALPELEAQGFFALLDGVYSSGQRFVSLESKVELIRNGRAETVYVSFVYEPEKNIKGEVIGIVVISYDITPYVKARLEIEQNAVKLVKALEDRDRSVRNLSTINRIGQQLSSILDMKTLVQTITDAGVEISGAQFGAFFYNMLDEQGKQLLLYTVSGAPPEAFSNFPNPRATEIFHPTFMGQGTVRSDDITKDPRYGKNKPYGGIPEGHLPVKSYLAVSVISRTGEVIGGLFFGHEKAGVFTEEATSILEGLASQTAIAMDNARLYQNLQQSINARDEFLSIASHELKTPLTSLMLQGTLRRKIFERNNLLDIEDGRLRKIFESDERQLRRLDRLIDDMLDISRIQTGKLTQDKKEVNLCDIVKDVMERFSPQFSEANTQASFISCPHAMIMADPFRIEQVVVNLLTNALKYGGKKPVIVEVSTLENKALLKVIDQGMGINRENQIRIFKRFERAISHNEISGLGLGLSISKEIVEAHGGSITVVSEPGKGSTFVVEFPLSLK